MQRRFVDQMGRSIEIDFPPKRIVSLVPSQTELLFDLGLHEEIVGITKFCIHPQDLVKEKIKIGGTKKFNFPKIKELAPGLIIGNKEENEQQQIESLSKEFPTWMSDINTLEDAYQMIKSIGDITGKINESFSIINTIQERFRSFQQEITTLPKICTVYFIWKDPLMCAGNRTFINDMMKCCGFENALEKESDRYPTITLKSLQELNPQLVLLSSEPYPFKEKHIEEFRKTCPKAIVKIVDGELFSWYGSRLLHSPAYFRELLESLKKEIKS